MRDNELEILNLVILPIAKINMSKQQNKVDALTRRRLRTSYITSVISISLVLFMLGLLGLILLHAKKISDHVKENIGLTVFINDNAKEADILIFQKNINAMTGVKASDYISKEEGAKELKQDLGEDFLNFLGYNPLHPSIEVFLKADYANNDSIPSIEKKLMQNKDVKEVVYIKSLIKQVNDNVKKITLVLLVLSSILLLIAVALISNTIRLSVFAKRFLIRSMQLVGATESFIRRPFIIKGIVQGIYGSLIAMFLLTVIIYIVRQKIPEIINLKDYDLYLYVYGVVTFLGIVISWISNYLAVRKYLRMKTDFLYL